MVKMVKDNYTTDVFFVIDEEGVTAVFPNDIADSQGNPTCYAHVGQHSACTKEWYNELQLATENEYIYLWAELEDLGYTLNIIERP